MKTLVQNISLWICFSVTFLFIVPLLYLLLQLQTDLSFKLNIDGLDLFKVFFQSIFSATLSLFFGLGLSISYLRGSQKFQRTIVWGLIPQVLPTVVIVYAYIKLFSFFGLYPQSIFHVVVVHVLINMGLVNFLILPYLKEQVEKKIHLMVTLQIGFLKIVRLIVWGELRAILFYLWVLVFSFSLTSFSVPLLLSGLVPSSFDYLIYLKGYIEGNWSAAAFLGLIEFVFLGLLFFFKSQKMTYTYSLSNIEILRSKWSYLGSLNFLPVILIFLSFTIPDLEVFLKSLHGLKEDLPDIFINTTFLVFWTLWFYSFIFWTQAYILKFKVFRIFHQFYWSISPILMSFILLSISVLFLDSTAVKIPVTGLSIALFIYPIIFKIWILPEYNVLKDFYFKIDILGLDYDYAFQKIILPYLKSIFKISIGYVFLFALADFTLSSVLLGDTKTLGLSIRNFILSYRLIEAQIMSFILVIVVMCLVFFFRGQIRENSKI